MKPFLALIATVLIISSCSTTKRASRSITLPEVAITASDDSYHETPALHWDITHTDLAISFNFAEKTAHGTATLSLKPYFYSSDKIVLDAQSMDINYVRSSGKNLKVNYSGDSLTIYLDRPYHRNESIDVTIDYIAKPYAVPSEGGKAITDDKGLYFINTDNSVPNKPVQIWTQGETEANSHWVPTNDQPNERFTTEIRIIVPDSMTTLSNGSLTDQLATEDGMRTDTWVMDKDIQPYVMMMAVGKFSIIEDEKWNGKNINYYVEPEFAPYAKDMFKNTPEMVDYFSKVTGVPYPWDKYSQVVVRDYVSGAMENTSATLFGEFINQTSREILDKDYEDVVSHELFHQWFGDYVTAESWSNLTLNESFATYGEQLWRNYKYGQASQEELAFDDLNLYLGQSKKSDEHLVRFHYNKADDMFDRTSYQKGGAILHYLHGLIGDTAFYQSMNEYLTKHALQPAEAHNWRMAVEYVTGKDWNWFFNQWYYRGGHPVLDVKYKFDDNSKKVTISITQEQEALYKLPLKINVVTKEHTFSDIIDLKNKTTDVTYPYYNDKRPAVIVDADHWLVGKLNDNKTNEHWLDYYKVLGKEEYISKLNAVMANGYKLTNTTVQDLFRLALYDHLAQIRATALTYLQIEKNSSVQKLFKTDVLFLAKEDASNHVRAAANYVIQAWKIDDAENQLYSSLEDESYMVAGSALNALWEINKDTTYTLAKQLLKQGPKGNLLSAIWIVMGKAAYTADSTYILNNKYHITGKDKMSFAAAMGEYMKNVPSDNSFKIALDVTEYLATSEAIGGYRATIASYLYDAGYYYKDQVDASNNKADLSKVNRRLNLLRESMLLLEEQEKDKTNLANFKMYRKEIYGK